MNKKEINSKSSIAIAQFVMRATGRYSIRPAQGFEGPGRYILYRQNHFTGLTIHEDDSCAISTSHRPCDNLSTQLWMLENTFEAVFKVISTVGVCSPCAPTGSEKDLQGGSDRRRQKSEQDAGECEENRGRQAVCLTGALRAEVFMTAFQRKRRTQSGLEACERKAARLARMDGPWPRLIQPSSATFPISPMQFDPETAPNVEVLKMIHPHARDFRIAFRSSDHTYFVDGQRTLGSVTGMIHASCAPFEADNVIARMMSGRNWPRAGYLKPEVSFTWMSRLGIFCPEILDLYSGSPRDDERISQLLRDLSSTQDIAAELDQLTLSPDDIKAMWEARGREAAHYGTYMHYLFEALINGHSVPQVSPEVRMLRSFLSKCAKDLTAWRTEWTIFGDEERLAGSIDFCARLPNGEMVLVDWKRTAGLPGKFNSAYHMRSPLCHLADCTGVHYRLQLNVYRHLLEKYYDVRVARMLVVCCHPEHYPTAFVDEVPRLEKETEDMLAAWCDARGGSTDYCGGKEASESAADIVEIWREIQFETPDVSTFQGQARQDLAQPQPVHAVYLPTEDDLDSYSSDDGIWDLRHDWYSQARHPRAPLDVAGGSFPAELLHSLPSFFFSFEYLHALASTSKAMRDSVRSGKHWRGRVVSLNTEEFQDTGRVRWMREVYLAAQAVVVSVKQLAMMQIFPKNVLLDWSAVPFSSGPVTGFESSDPLVGAASFELRLPATAVGMYIGVRDWSSLRDCREASCRLDNLLRSNSVVSCSFHGSPPQPSVVSGRPCLRANRSHRFDVRWSEHVFELSIDEACVLALRTRANALDGPDPLAKLSLRIWMRSRSVEEQVLLQPLPSPVCHRSRLLASKRCVLIFCVVVFRFASVVSRTPFFGSQDHLRALWIPRCALKSKMGRLPIVLDLDVRPSRPKISEKALSSLPEPVHGLRRRLRNLGRRRLGF